MVSKSKDNTVTLTIDSRQVTAEHHEPVLKAAKRLGIDIPTLCHHDDLEPMDACRLCLVEIERKGRRKFVTACNYPVEEGLEVTTASDAVLAHRKMIVELLLARCPSVPRIQELAAGLGVDGTRFQDNTDTCILCGLCTRVCETFATTSIAVLGRGDKKSIGTVGDAPPEDCVGCGACAQICPTGHITDKRSTGRYEIWNREFKTATCVVDEEKCRGCGACEEACPFAVPRVALRRNGQALAAISVDACRGCGVCFGACPSGAIAQPRAKRQLPAIGVSNQEPRSIMVVACPRSKLAGPFGARLPDSTQVVELPCSGGVSTSLLLRGLAAGFDGVLVLSRHQATCRFDGSEHLIGPTVAQADALAELSGLGAGRVVFAEPDPGPDGPRAAVNQFSATLDPSPLKTYLPVDEAVDTLQGALDVLTWLSGRAELQVYGARWLAEQGLPAAVPGKPTLLAAGIPYLDLLLRPWLAPFALGSLLRDARTVLEALGIDSGVAVGGFRGGDEALAGSLNGTEIYSLCGGCRDRFVEAGARVTTMNELLRTRGGELKLAVNGHSVALDTADETLAAAVRSMGFSTGHAGPNPGCGLAMAVPQAELAALTERLTTAASTGASTLAVGDPSELVQHLMQVRRGAWRRVHIQPLLATSLAAASLG